MPEKIIIVGAPRSGTNMLRDMLIKLDGVETWPCDEINYIWRHGNKNYPSDEFTPDMATPKVKLFINNEFRKFAASSKADVVIEKTCATSMRVGFVNEVLPEAKYIFIVRDGADVVGSAMLRWKAKLDIPYLLKKVRYVPLVDLPFYAKRYLGSRIYRIFSNEKRLSFWGPQMNDMHELLEQYSLRQVCALQWQCCVENTERDFSKIEPNRVLRVRYEDFVSNPADEFSRIAQFINKDVSDSIKKSIRESVTNKSIGKGRASLQQAGIDEITPLISENLRKHGYKS